MFSRQLTFMRKHRIIFVSDLIYSLNFFYTSTVRQWQEGFANIHMQAYLQPSNRTHASSYVEIAWRLIWRQTLHQETNLPRPEPLPHSRPLADLPRGLRRPGRLSGPRIQLAYLLHGNSYESIIFSPA